MNTNSAHLELDTVLSTLADGVIMINGRGIVERYNPACEIIFVYTSQEVIGKNIRLLMPDPYHNEHDDYISNFQKTAKPKIIGIGRKVSGKHKSGLVFPMYLSVGEIPNVEGRAYVGIIRDLTEETQRRSEFEKLQREYYHLSRVSAMDQMGAAIAHEINQPLAAIMNYMGAGNALLSSDESLDTRKLIDVMSKSSAQAQRAAKILSRLRLFIETGDVDKQSVSLDHLVTSSIALILPQFNAHNIRIHTDLDQDGLEVFVSEVQIQQVLVNIIKNACEAMLEGKEKTLTIKSIYEGSDHIKITVCDTGSGLFPGKYESLFTPFTSNKRDGLGVGLSICRSIVENHGGRIWAETNQPQGSCFHFTLPVSNISHE